MKITNALADMAALLGGSVHCNDDVSGGRYAQDETSTSHAQTARQDILIYVVGVVSG